jgi:hypothetical protein
MKAPAALLFALALATPALAQQGPVRVRGEVVAFDGAAVTVKTREAGTVRVELAKNATVAWRKPMTLADLKPGMPLGTTAVKGPDGKLVAREIQVFPGAAAPNPGHRPMDDGATMTNATLSATVAASKGRELTLSYPGGSQQVAVPEDTLIYTPVDGERSLLRPGVPVSFLATQGPDGRLATTRVQVTKQ